MMERGWGVSEGQVRQARLLVWLAAQEHVGFYNVVDSGLYRSDQMSVATNDLDSLRDNGLAKTIYGFELGELAAAIEPRGRDRAYAVEAAMTDRATRRHACRSAFVAWLYEVDAVDRASERLRNEFLTDARYAYFGQPFTAEEVDQAVGWLHQQQLVDGATGWGVTGPLSCHLTTKGMDCAEQYGSDVRRYLAAMSTPASSSTTNEWHVQADNLQIATGDNAQQTMTVQDASAQLNLVLDGLVELLKDKVEWTEDLRQDHEAAVETLRTAQPDVGMVRSFLDKLRADAEQRASEAVIAAVSALSGLVLHDVGQLTQHALGG